MHAGRMEQRAPRVPRVPRVLREHGPEVDVPSGALEARAEALSAAAASANHNRGAGRA